MTNDEARKNDEIRSPKEDFRFGAYEGSVPTHSSFVIRHSFVLGYFVIRHS
jgi:hypothetical protein